MNVCPIESEHLKINFFYHRATTSTTYYQTHNPMHTLHLIILAAKAAYHAVQATLIAHPVAVHRVVETFDLVGKGAGFLRTLDWARSKFRTKKETPAQPSDQKKHA